MERFAVAQALYKAFAAAVRTKEPGNLRGRADAEFEAMFADTGADRVRLRVNGVDVGTMSVKWARECEGPEVASEAAYDGWLAANGEERFDFHPEWLTAEQRRKVADVMELMHPGSAACARVMPTAVADGLAEGPGGTVVTAEGEVVPGLAWVRHPREAAGTVARVDVDKVAQAVGSLPASEVLGLIGEGEGNVD